MKKIIIKCISLLCAGLLVCTAEFFILHSNRNRLLKELDSVAIDRYNALAADFTALEQNLYKLLTEKDAREFTAACYACSSAAANARDALDEICENEEVKSRGLSFLGEIRVYFYNLGFAHAYSSALNAMEYSEISSYYAICKPAAEEIRKMQADVNTNGAEAVKRIFSVDGYSKAFGTPELSFFRCDLLFYSSKLPKKVKVISEKPFYKPKRAMLYSVLKSYCSPGAEYYRLIYENADELRFSSSSSCAVIDKSTGGISLLSRVKINGAVILTENECKTVAEQELYKQTEQQPESVNTRFFEGIYYFDFIFSSDKKITVGIDGTDGNVAFINSVRQAP